MLQTLSIRDFVIVDALELEFEPGFTVFSGETGAGKSILIDALALVLGERGDADVVREGRPRADLGATFSIDADVAAWLVEHDMLDEAADDADDHAGASRVLMRRTIDASGRSRAWINGSSATLGQLRELGDRLVDIHGQHAHQLLLRGGAQRRMLDAQGGLEALAGDVQRAVHEWRELEARIGRLESDAEAVERERDQLAWQVDELSKLAVRSGEWDAIGEEHRRLSNAASLIDGARGALDALSEAEDAIASRLSQVHHRVAQLVEVDPLLKPAIDALEPARIEIDEASHALNAYLNRIELDPGRLAEVESRMDAIHAVSRKLRVAPDQMPALLETQRARLAMLEGSDDLEGLRARERDALAAYRRQAERLSKERGRVAKDMGRAITDAMQSLSMSGGRFEIALLPSKAGADPDANGLEDIEFRVAAHPGSTPRALAKVASGGELARISLAISVIASTATTVPTLIFDEVDSGIGGAVAEVVGRLLRQLGQSRQVLCVTHLPQVAALGNDHFAVSKRTVDARASTSIERLDGTARIDEVARMLGGVDITTTTRRHARELLALR